METHTKTANFVCYDGDLFPNGSIQNFGYQFEAKQNVTFSWDSAMKSAFAINYFCSPWYFIIKEFVKRTQFNAIPVYVEEETRLTIPGYETSYGPHMSYIKQNRLDIFLSVESLTDMSLLFTKTSIAAFNQVFKMSLLSARHVSNEKDSYFSIFHIFDLKIWFLVFIEIIAVCVITTIEFLRINRNEKFWSTFYREWLRVHEIVCFKYFKMKKWTPVLHIIYCSFLIVSMILMYSFSSLILSRTIHNPYIFIETLEQLLDRHDIKPLLTISGEDIQQIEKIGFDSEKSILRLSEQNNISPESGSDFIVFALNAKEIKSRLWTHVVISDSDNLLLLKGNHQSLQISPNHYFPRPYSMVFNKNLNHSIVEPLERILFDSKETGLYNKWVSAALNYGWKMTTDTELETFIVLADEEKKYTFSNYKIVLGPYISGIFMSIMIFICENKFTIMLIPANLVKTAQKCFRILQVKFTR